MRCFFYNPVPDDSPLDESPVKDKPKFTPEKVTAGQKREKPARGRHPKAKKCANQKSASQKRPKSVGSFTNSTPLNDYQSFVSKVKTKTNVKLPTFENPEAPSWAPTGPEAQNVNVAEFRPNLNRRTAPISLQRLNTPDKKPSQ